MCFQRRCVVNGGFTAGSEARTKRVCLNKHGPQITANLQTVARCPRGMCSSLLILFRLYRYHDFLAKKRQVFGCVVSYFNNVRLLEMKVGTDTNVGKSASLYFFRLGRYARIRALATSRSKAAVAIQRQYRRHLGARRA